MSPEIEIVDAPARELISRSGLGRTLFVEAGAGSGKTSQLVERIANLVVDRGVRLAEIAAITFTEAAAAELQSRIRVQFERRAEASTDPAERERCRVAIAEADLAAISTLHGFASRLLGEFSTEAHLPPRVRVLDEVSSQLAHEARWERFVDGLYDDPANEAVLVRAAMVGVPLEPRYQGHATLKDVAAELAQNWDRIGELAAVDHPPLGPAVTEPFDRAAEAVMALPSACTDPDDKFFVHLVTEVIPEMSAIVGIADDERKLQALSGAKWSKGRGGTKAAWGGDVASCKALIDEVNEAAAAVRDAAADEVLQRLLTLAAREVLAAAAARRDEGGLEFHDLLVLARELLRTSPTARTTLHERYTHLLLDEFQDTDPIQIELAMLIASSIDAGDGDPGPGFEPPAAAPAHWSDLRVAEGRLFFVGDPKQSIYRFRRADIDLFLRARDRFGIDGASVKLTTNFRTVAPVVEWVNALFENAMPEEVPGAQPRYEPLVPFRRPEAGNDHRPLLLGGPHPNPKVRAAELREAEAADVARTVRDVQHHPERWPVHDEHSGEWRPATLADVTILVPTRTSLPFLRAALEASAIPYRLATGTLVYDSQDVADVLAAVRAVDDPSDELSLVAALRSPLYACSDVDLFTFHDAGGRWNLRVKPPESVAADHPVRLALAHLRSLWVDRWWLTPATLVDRIVRERQADLLAFGDPRPREVWRRLRFLVDQARTFEEAGGGGLRAFVEWAALHGADGARVHEPLLPETDDDAVRILTIHGSKGLEFPITILSGMTTQPGNARRGVSVVWGDDGPPEVRLNAKAATANHEPRADIEIEMDAYEKLRLLYVATTRARDHLVVSCHHKVSDKPVDTYARRVWTFFHDRPDLVRPEAPDQGSWREVEMFPGVGGVPATPEAVVPAAPLTPSPPAAGDPDRDAWIAEREALLAPQRRARFVSATAVATSALAPPVNPSATGSAATAPAAGDPADPAWADDDPVTEPPTADDAVGAVPTRRRGRAGTAIGRAVHATLQVLDLADPHDIELQAHRQCDVEAIPEEVRTVTALVRSALDSTTVREAAVSTHHKELYVAAPVGARVIEGFVDLLIETPDGLIVVDYKTDAAASDAAIDAALARYELQGASYAVALEAVTGIPVIDCRFVFCKARGAVERSVRDLPAAMARVRATVA
jgi:ATP-dependent exoDNAse (exonuclease V) beta subunit